MDDHVSDSTANLLSLGATSIHMIRIANLLEKEIGFRPPMDKFYGEPTVASLAAMYAVHLEEHRTDTGASAGDVRTVAVPDVGGFDLILDPDDRNAFKARQPGLRPPDTDEAFIALPTIALDRDLQRAYQQRRSCRSFIAEPLPIAQLGNLLGCLRQVRIGEETRYRYGSAGGLYPVQTYIYAKPNRVARMGAGVYYYHPADHRLVALDTEGRIDRRVYEPIINAPIFDTAAFALFFVAQMNAIGPMYGERSLHYATLEAGLMAQLLEAEAPAYGIGMCQIGELDFDSVRELFVLTPTHTLVHSMLGGPIDVDPIDGQVSGRDAVVGRTEGADGWEEGEL